LTFKTRDVKNVTIGDTQTRADHSLSDSPAHCEKQLSELETSDVYYK